MYDVLSRHAEDFIKWHGEIQNSLFTAIAESNGLSTTDITTLYTEYNLQVNIGEQVYDNCNLSNYSNYIQNYILSAKKKYTSSNFSRNSDVLAYINEKKQDTMNKESAK